MTSSHDLEEIKETTSMCPYNKSHNGLENTNLEFENENSRTDSAYIDDKNNEISTETDKGRCGRLIHICKCCLWEFNSHPQDDAGVWTKMKRAIMCPPHGLVAKWITWGFLGLLLWGACVTIFGDDAMPSGNVFGIVVLLMACLLGGYLIERIPLPGPPLPPLLGMLLVGFALRNIPSLSVTKEIDSTWSSSLRLIALAIILVRAGLGLDGEALIKLKWVLLSFASLTAIAECTMVALCSTVILQFPLDWGFVLGFILCAVSPAVVVPSLLYLQDMGYGVKGGIPSFLIAGASLNDVIGITGFNVVLGMIFSDGEILQKVLHGPIELALGIFGGLIMGVLLWYLPPRDTKFCNGYRALALLGLSLLCCFGGKRIHYGGAGALATLVLAFVAAVRWGPGKNPIAEVFGYLWLVFQPLLFGLIGASVTLGTIEPETLGLGALLIILGLVIRAVVSYVTIYWSDFNVKEKLFVTIAWTPKATVQAAIGAIALETAEVHNAPDEVVEYGRKVLTIAVLAILMTAPSGAAAIGLSGPRFLTKEDTEKNSKEFADEIE